MSKFHGPDGIWYKIAITIYDEKHSYLSIPLYDHWKPEVADRKLLLTKFVGSEWSVEQLNGNHVVLADRNSAMIIAQLPKLVVPLVVFLYPNIAEFTAKDIKIERARKSEISDELAIELAWKTVKPFTVAQREHAELHPPIVKPEVAVVEPIKAKKTVKEFVPANPTARQDLNDPAVWIINCEDCNKERKCHKADLFQIRRCKECQTTFQKVKHVRPSEKVEIVL